MGNSDRRLRRDQRPPVMRVFDRVLIQPDGCWEYTGAKSSGYGRINLLEAGNQATHRIVYEALAGPIPDGREIDHLCRNRACCNPGHLETVTSSENTRRGLAMQNGAHNRIKSHCRNGHPYDAENTRIVQRASGKSERQCRICARAAAARAQSRRAV